MAGKIHAHRGSARARSHDLRIRIASEQHARQRMVRARRQGNAVGGGSVQGVTAQNALAVHDEKLVAPEQGTRLAP